MVIENYAELKETVFERPIHPMDETFGTRKTELTDVVYINREDFREDANKKFFRLTKTQKVRLKYTAGLVEYVSHSIAENGSVKEIRVRYTPDTTTKVKGILGWVSEVHSVPATFNVYGQLLDDNNEFNSESLQVKKGLVETPSGMANSNRYQIERMGYYTVVKFKEKGNFCELNQIVTLRESRDKKLLK